MERITRFRKESQKAIALSFVDSLMFMAVPYQRNLFEPRLFRSILNFKPMCEYFDNINLVIDVIEAMNLKRRIWGKAGAPAAASGSPEDTANLGYPKSEKTLKSDVFEEFFKRETADARNMETLIKKVTKNGDILALCHDSDDSYWVHHGSAKAIH
ncbi:MAG: DUF3137 domain-containing protein [Desulfobacterales bacterium]|nr:DUF3137 domain-containing protein [Desulfobacterales bacterium]